MISSQICIFLDVKPSIVNIALFDKSNNKFYSSEIMIYPSLKQLQVFVVVSELKSFAKAAEFLNLSQPAVSEAITQLEQRFGSILIRRTTRSMALTQVGEYLLPRARGVVDELSRMMSDVSDMENLKRGHVNIGCLASISYQYLPRVIAQFQQTHPDIKLNVRDDNAAGLSRLLETREIDFAITSKVETNIGAEFESLLTDTYHLLCRSDHPLASRRSVDWAELKSESYLGWAKGTANRFALERSLIEARIILTPTFELSQLGTMLGMVDLALGVAAVPFLACPTSPKYAAPLLTAPQISREVGIATLIDNPPSAAAKRFIAMVSNQLRDTL